MAAAVVATHATHAVDALGRVARIATRASAMVVHVGADSEGIELQAEERRAEHGDEAHKSVANYTIFNLRLLL